MKHQELAIQAARRDIIKIIEPRIAELEAEMHQAHRDGFISEMEKYASQACELQRLVDILKGLEVSE